jgi:alpha-tubulin suppressor-like RCC1 family protein
VNEIISNVGQVASISPGGRHTLMLTSRGEVFTCGSNDFGQLGREGSQTRLEQVRETDKKIARKTFEISVIFLFVRNEVLYPVLRIRPKD